MVGQLPTQALHGLEHRRADDDGHRDRACAAVDDVGRYLVPPFGGQQVHGASQIEHDRPGVGPGQLLVKELPHLDRAAYRECPIGSGHQDIAVAASPHR
jgi:hypothetical protein